MVSAAARRSGHHDDVARAEQNRDWRDVARETTNEEDCSVSETNGVSLDHGEMEGEWLTRSRRGVRWHRFRSDRRDP